MHSRSLSGTDADLIKSAEIASRIEGTALVSMYRDIQHIRIVPKSPLCPVSMMHIPYYTRQSSSLACKRALTNPGLEPSSLDPA